MNKKDKLKKLLDTVKSLEGKRSVDNMGEELDTLTSRLISEESARVASQLGNNSVVKILSKLSTEMSKIKKGFDIQPVITAIKDIKDDTTLRDETRESIRQLEASIKEVTSMTSKQFADFPNQLTSSEARLATNLNNALNQLRSEIPKSFDNSENAKKLKKLDEELDDLRRDLMERIANRGGGAMNRQMFIGNVDPLKTYTDMNLKAGSNVTITYVNNNTTKRVDVTIASSGSGGAGITREINSVAVNTAAGSASDIDYVYLVSGTTTITLPTAVGNENLYTIKNVGTGVVTVATTGVETIDASPTVIMPVRYTSVDIISDTANWNVT